ncbi:Bug family tripartite tricarboxylate transporter substrate binding protein [Vineibacter terrae]|uniref:Bug family tripartite tricarboxylate transporter substrate binding protein n=1 Tax=Vineibacter terrae TaxID=2586908 RepID=UPI002E37CE42|nr:tripartite tricarboxylate transporter substrate-binding protein [Vineibacter terrae]HEX2889633.1 tripartite tricarboxylate transporter substrate-binding protein [Vineibacter terrae]
MSGRTALRIVWLLVAGLAGAARAQAEYPDKVIRIVVPFAPGTGLDVIARGFAERFTSQMGVTALVENRDGAGGILGSGVVKSAPPDGYTLLFTAHPPFAVAMLLQRTPSYDPGGDFTPVAKVAAVPMVLVASNAAQFGSFDAFVDSAGKNPGRLTYASSGIGTPSHLNMERIKLARGLAIQDAPYKSAAQAMTDVMAGHVPLYLPSFPAALPHLAAGKLRGLAIGSAKRAAALPDMPTMAEALAQPGFEAVVWYGFLAPAGTAPAIVARLEAEITQAMATPQMKDILSRLGAEPAMASGNDLAALIRRDVGDARKLLDELKLKPEN